MLKNSYWKISVEYENCKLQKKKLVENMLEKVKALGRHTSIKLHFLHSLLEYFPGNLGTISEEWGQRFHQDIKDMEQKYQGRWECKYDCRLLLDVKKRNKIQICFNKQNNKMKISALICKFINTVKCKQYVACFGEKTHYMYCICYNLFKRCIIFCYN